MSEFIRADVFEGTKTEGEEEDKAPLTGFLPVGSGWLTRGHGATTGKQLSPQGLGLAKGNPLHHAA